MNLRARHFTLADQAVIDTLDEETRAVVERYVSAGGSGASVISDDVVERAYLLGYAEAVEEVRAPDVPRRMPDYARKQLMGEVSA